MFDITGREKFVDDPEFDEVAELMETDTEFKKRHQQRSNLTRALGMGLLALGGLALYTRHVTSMGHQQRSSMNSSSQSTSTAGGDGLAEDVGAKLSADVHGKSSGSNGTPSHGKLDMGAAMARTDDAMAGSEDPSGADMTTDVFESVDVVVHDGAVPIHASLSCKSVKARYVRVVYGCSAEGCDTMATPWEEISAQNTHTIKLYRMRAFTDYTIDLMYSESRGEVADDEMVAATRHISTGSTGVSALDVAPYARFSGDLGFQTYLTERSGYGFYGFIGLDPAGYVVWALNVSAADYMSSIGDLPSHAIAQFPDDYSFAVLCQGKKQLTRYNAAGEQVGSAYSPPYDSACGALSHEVFIDTSTGRNQVLSLMHDVAAFDGTPTEFTLGQKLVKWDHINNTMQEEFSIFSTMDPREVVSWEDPFFPGELECTNDQGVYAQYEMSDFTHCNSAATGIDDNYLISSRATSSILSVAKDGSGVQWMVSSNTIGLSSNFTFLDESDMFYNQHFVRQLPNGNLVMIDNGNTRPSSRRRLQDVGGVAMDGSQPYNPAATADASPMDEGVTDDSSSFSRACEYALNFEDGTIELVWEFAPSGIFTVEGGSIDALSNGNRLITFPFIIGDDGGYYSYVYEVNPSGVSVANMSVPWMGNSSLYDTPTRGLAVDTIAGERAYNSTS